MENIFITIFKRITVLNSILMILYCFFHPNLGDFQFMFIIMILLVISWLMWLAGKISDYFMRNKHKDETKLRKNSILGFICFKFYQEIETVYSTFLALYLLFYRQSTSVAYLVLLLFGLYLGHKMTERADRYIRQANERNSRK